ncbi:hypothetical protein HPB48_025942 [Haemaphysalis longicornis]|uniref:Uncharacterized protein n=1 Tax=Haemaphysalis longicornis TaxID=44386 RepID=A0A9J6HB23_HAELO|nr:hypothetical protein HPB48_025942 [Haemaphysalis longicornis]
MDEAGGGQDHRLPRCPVQKKRKNSGKTLRSAWRKVKVRSSKANQRRARHCSIFLVGPLAEWGRPWCTICERREVRPGAASGWANRHSCATMRAGLLVERDKKLTRWDSRVPLSQRFVLCDTDFDKWRLGEEESQRCRFVKQHGASSIAGGKLRTYYRCHRSGTAAPRRGKGVRLMKSRGSCKSGKICLASITATTNADGTPGASVEVSYQKHHYGHYRDVTHLMMTPAERAKIAAELKTGVAMITVMDRISASIGGADLTPLQATERIQLHNISSSSQPFCSRTVPS